MSPRSIALWHPGIASEMQELCPCLCHNLHTRHDYRSAKLRICKSEMKIEGIIVTHTRRRVPKSEKNLLVKIQVKKDILLLLTDNLVTKQTSALQPPVHPICTENPMQNPS